MEVARRAAVMNVLAINTGSSSVRALLTRFDERAPSGAELWRAHQSTGSDEPGAVLERLLAAGDAAPLRSGHPVDAVGHRIVHGGAMQDEIALLTGEVKREIERAEDFAPLHNRAALEALGAAERLIPGAPHFAVFDTGFHATLPEAAFTYPGPYEWRDAGIRRYGFHGINHRYAARRTAELLARPLESLRIVTCHLGSGGSLTAVDGGRSVDTTMGFTPLEGLMMGTRSGSVDPGILLYLLRNRGYDAAGLDRLLNEESGLKGLSGLSADMRRIVEAAQHGHARARLAFDVYVHRLCREIAGMAAALGGVDALTFTGGIGENSAEVRESSCRRLAFLGVELDESANRLSPMQSDIASPHSRVRVVVVRSGEEVEIARLCRDAMMLPQEGDIRWNRTPDGATLSPGRR